MTTIIRTYITNEARFNYLKRTVQSCVDKEMLPLAVLDNCSPYPWNERIIGLTSIHPAIQFIRSQLGPSTMNGFLSSLICVRGEDRALFLEDDVVLGKGIKEMLSSSHDCPMLSLYAAYARGGSGAVWQYPNHTFYGLVGTVFRKDFVDIMLAEMRDILKGDKPVPNCHADIWVKELTIARNLPIYNTIKDYVQHVGNEVRSINEGKIDCRYESMYFVGE